MIKALLFDFDGLILDTESPEYHTWQAIYGEHGHELPARLWGQIVGGHGAAEFDAAAHLESLVGRPLEHDALNRRFRSQSNDMILAQPVLPGVNDILAKAIQMRLKLAVASSSQHGWVDGHLQRLGLSDYFDAVICREDVARTKPHPDLFLAALQALGVRPEEAIVFEDSPNGVKAGRAAGIFTVAVPNPLTAQLQIDGADLRLASLTDLPLEDLLARVNQG